MFYIRFSISVEFAGELHDFIKEDIVKWYPDLVQNNVKIILVCALSPLSLSLSPSLSLARSLFVCCPVHFNHAPVTYQIEATDHILGTFDRRLSDYVMDAWKSRRNMEVRTSTLVKQVKSDAVELKVQMHHCVPLFRLCAKCMLFAHVPSRCYRCVFLACDCLCVFLRFCALEKHVTLCLL